MSADIVGSDFSARRFRDQLKAAGVFYTPPELCKLLASFLPEKPRNVYDPTCGAGNLLAVFGDDVPKYGQDIDPAAVQWASEHIPNFHGHVGSTLTDPGFIDLRFEAIIANPPFSVKYEPEQVGDELRYGPTLPPPSKADYAFILHILHVLADDGVAAVMGFPGILYRGAREGKIRAWLIEQNWVDKVVHIPGGTFEDTSIATCCLVLRKNRGTTDIEFINKECDLSRMVGRDEIVENEYSLSMNLYVSPPEPEKEKVDPIKLEQECRKFLLKHVDNSVSTSLWVAALERETPGFPPFKTLIQDLQALIDEKASLGKRLLGEAYAGKRL